MMGAAPFSSAASGGTGGTGGGVSLPLLSLKEPGARPNVDRAGRSVGVGRRGVVARSVGVGVGDEGVLGVVGVLGVSGRDSFPAAAR